MRQASPLWPHLRILQAWGANTEVGKTIFSSVLSRAFRCRLEKVKYLKPISTGPLQDADDSHITRFGTGVQSKTLYQFSDPVSPHIAARESSIPVTDDAVRTKVYQELANYAKLRQDGVAIVETAGGVLSPAPSGSTQADLYRPLRLPAFLVGDPRLGGIGSTISAWESLHLRGYDVQSVALFQNDRYDNHSYLKDYFADRGVNSFAIAPPPERKSSAEEDAASLEAYYRDASSDREVDAFLDRFFNAHDKRCADLQAMPDRADKAIWHPFMQHRERSSQTIVAMDSAYDDYFQTYTKSQEISAPGTSLLKPAFDASASWWTQGLGHGNPSLALTAAHAAGRYGHVMFAGAVHEPALQLAQTLLQRTANPRLRKVFYTDNGSTGMEVAVKMALRTAAKRAGWPSAAEEPDAGKPRVEILGLIGSYHGDTIGTMDCSEPSIYNKKVEWYEGRGHWLDFPQVSMQQGQWKVDTPAPLQSALGKTRSFDSLDAVFDLSARADDAATYTTYLESELTRLSATDRRFGALILEPVILGAGGMMLADPLYQHCLVTTVRNLWPHVPVIFDEVFTGLYRLGRFSAADYLQTHPDIVVNAKLLTGGLLPLCTTTASDEVFEAFLSSDKSDALLHGHSYTAHAVGCAVANESLRAMTQLSAGPTWAACKQDWAASPTANGPQTWSMWSRDFVHSISHHGRVSGVFALGSVCAITLKDSEGAGYASTAATGLRDELFRGEEGREDGGAVVHSRVLGNVLYLMAAMSSSREALKGVEGSVLRGLA